MGSAPWDGTNCFLCVEPSPSCLSGHLSPVPLTKPDLSAGPHFTLTVLAAWQFPCTPHFERPSAYPLQGWLQETRPPAVTGCQGAEFGLPGMGDGKTRSKHLERPGVRSEREAW